MKLAIDPFRRGRITIRLLAETDLPMTMAWRNQDDVRIWFGHSDPVTEAGHSAWFKKYHELDNDFVFISSRNDTEEPIGHVSVFNVDWNKKEAEVGRLMIGDRRNRKQGFGQETFEALVELAHYKLGLKSLYLSVLENNTPAIRIYTKMLFTEHGRNGAWIVMRRGQ